MDQSVNERARGDWKLATESDIYYCYRLFLDREPDADGWTTYTTNIKTGMSVQSLVASFLNSVEFRNRQSAQSSAESTPLLLAAEDFRIYVSPTGSPVASPIIEGRPYEPHVAAAMRRLLKPGMVFVDVGASIGYLSMVAARAVGSEGKVICFEPDPYNCKLLYLSAKINGFENVEIYPFALADRSRNVIFDSMQGNGVISDFDVNLASTPLRFVVRALPLDQILRDEASIHALKMDVEGAEYMVLRGGARTLKEHRPIIFSEFSPAGLRNVSGVSGQDFLRLLVDAGYDISVLGFEHEVIECGDDIERVWRYYDELLTSHIDIVALPK
jgi:FkbM family methyltransferase